MSLVGSLEDLSLGDILQIISLSRKSGVLFLRGEDGEGRILFQAGLVQGAFAKGGPVDLRGLVVQGGALTEAAFEAVCAAARSAGVPLEAMLSAESALGAERLESLRRAAIESAITEMFRWRSGEFSFEIREEGEADREAGMRLVTGLSAQYLAMEATRLRDEAEGAGSRRDPAEDSGPSLVLSGDDEVQGATSAPREDPARAVELVASAAVEEFDAEPEVAVEAEADVATAIDEDAEPATIAEPAAPAPDGGDRPDGGVPPAVVAIDRELATLEWIKGALRGAFPRVHIFQRTELGVERIRQYLARGEAPVVIVSTRVPPDPWSGARDVGEVVERLKAQAPRTPILALVEAGTPDTAMPRADGCVEGPRAAAFSNPRLAGELEKGARRLERAIHAWAGRAGRRRAARDPLAGPSPDLARLRTASARLRDPASRGEVLPLVMRFAAETFQRVAIFMLRDDVAIGMAQLGLSRAGGPDDAGLRAVTFRTLDTPWFREVCETRGAVRRAPAGAADLALAHALGGQAPREAYLAPIESGERVVAILYADQLPGEAPISDTSALEVVLHEAGLAIDRAVLERALAE